MEKILKAMNTIVRNIHIKHELQNIYDFSFDIIEESEYNYKCESLLVFD